VKIDEQLGLLLSNPAREYASMRKLALASTSNATVSAAKAALAAVNASDTPQLDIVLKFYLSSNRALAVTTPQSMDGGGGSLGVSVLGVKVQMTWNSSSTHSSNSGGGGMSDVTLSAGSAGEKTPLLRQFHMNAMILPRQTRDKHRESTQKRVMRFRIAKDSMQFQMAAADDDVVSLRVIVDGSVVE
jgi:hypothetical protein